ncbi:2917_t:CDS:2 [Gigaspora margarita]|uniref:2917_t:CDS:1 n=1 Tax=Gigaspora margarita TaxID=4874 RepID=A0ABM8W6A8_GIGMA|nr:2917_t:CDS:2 [Gigaspora margarita]
MAESSGTSTEVFCSLANTKPNVQMTISSSTISENKKDRSEITWI